MDPDSVWELKSHKEYEEAMKRTKLLRAYSISSIMKLTINPQELQNKPVKREIQKSIAKQNIDRD